jgi:hypothetical protein
MPMIEGLLWIPHSLGFAMIHIKRSIRKKKTVTFPTDSPFLMDFILEKIAEITSNPGSATVTQWLYFPPQNAWTPCLPRAASPNPASWKRLPTSSKQTRNTRLVCCTVSAIYYIWLCGHSWDPSISVSLRFTHLESLFAVCRLPKMTIHRYSTLATSFRGPTNCPFTA